MASIQNLLGVPLPDCRGQPTCEPKPVCPGCGGLECLCRPRFFAGQLLTDEDLNRLDHYIQGKNRLHNRFLHGWGVACGLEVACGTCAPDRGQVAVRPGYALSPCGNDIVVCKTEVVDICDLINRCRPPTDDCHDSFTEPAPPPPPGMASPTPPENSPEEWVLAICYAEKPSRGMAALRAQPPEIGCGCGAAAAKTGSGCGCGTKNGYAQPGNGGGCGCGTKSTGGGCGCQGAGSTARRKAPMAASRSLPEQCEPTVICEGYRFVVYKLPKKARAQRTYGAAERRFRCCIGPLLDHLAAPGPEMSLSDQQDWLIAFRDAVRDFVVNEGLYDCELAETLGGLEVPVAADNVDPVELNDRTARLIARVAALVLKKCYCAALLPACPEPSQSDCVPLATVTVQTTRGKCRVRRVCNIGARQFLATIPNIEYWLTFVADLAPLRQSLDKLCCTPEPLRQGKMDADFFKQAGKGILPDLADQFKKVSAPGTLFGMSLNDSSHKLTFEHLMLAALGAQTSQGQPFATAEELAHPTEAIMFNQVLAPFLRTFMTSQPPAVAPTGANPRGLEQQFAELQAKVNLLEKQQQTTNKRKNRDR